MHECNARLLEHKLPLSEINLSSEIEMSFRTARARFKSDFKKVFGFDVAALSKGLPQPHNLHTWFARRPTSAARALTAAAVLPARIDLTTFKDIIGLNEQIRRLARNGIPPIIYMTKPNRSKLTEIILKSANRSLHEIVVVDPMAGGGSIPLESLRLGFETIAVEYNPVAYLILKATVEFPAKYADAGLFEETLKAAKEFIKRAREELGKYYGEGAENYIFARGVRCPFCGGLIPVQGVAPQITKRFRRRYLKIEFDKERKTFTAETTDTRPSKPFEKRGNNIRCPYCGRWFQLRGRVKTGQTAFDKWFQEHTKLMRSVVEELEQVTPEMEEKLLELHIPLVKQVGDTFIAIWDDEDEKRRFVQAFRDLSNDILELQDYIPLDEITPENKWASTARNRGLTHWYMLFNPRQLLAVAKLSKLVAETAEKLASKNGEFGAAVALYLAFAIDKIADYNNIATLWNAPKGTIAHMLRGESTIDFRQEYAEMVVTLPERSLEWALEPHIAESGELTKTAGGILPVLRFLCDEFRSAGLGNRVRVYLGDATRLSEILGVGTVDVINVDPPYFEQVIYSDKSEFFWVILRRALRPVLELLFKPGLRLPGWSWTSPTVPREREVVTYDKRDSSGRFRRFFREFIMETYKVLKDDDVLVLWFTHPTDVAWRTIGESLYEAGYVVSKVWPVQTEYKLRFKRTWNLVAQETSLVIVARKYPRKKLVEIGADVKGSLLNHPEFVEATKSVVEDARKVSREASASPADMMALMLGSALSVATRFEIPGLNRFDSLFDTAATKVDELFVTPLLHKVLVESGPVKLAEADASRVVEYVRRAMLRDAATRSYITLWFLSRVDLETGRYRNEPLPLSYDFAQTVTKLLGYDIDRLRETGLTGESIVEEAEGEEEEESGGKRKGKAFYPLMFEALSAAGARTTWTRLSSLIPGRALYLAYLALNESGAPSVRANSIRRKISMWSSEDVAEAASLAIVLLETARDIDLGFKQAQVKGLDRFFHGGSGGSEAMVTRELAIRTLLHLLPRV